LCDKKVIKLANLGRCCCS